jgi:hypothetical protein
MYSAEMNVVLLYCAMPILNFTNIIHIEIDGYILKFSSYSMDIISREAYDCFKNVLLYYLFVYVEESSFSGYSTFHGQVDKTHSCLLNIQLV